jgi:hypothetical protein
VNAAPGIGTAAQHAMLAGVMFRWHIRQADPANLERNAPRFRVCTGGAGTGRQPVH